MERKKIQKKQLIELKKYINKKLNIKHKITKHITIGRKLSYMFFLLVLGFVLIVKGADFIVKGATSLAKKMKISEMIIGILIVGIGTSLPEIIITIRSALLGKSDIVIGNGIGSSICNILLVVGIASICKPVKIDKRIRLAGIKTTTASRYLIESVCFFATLGSNNSIEI